MARAAAERRGKRRGRGGETIKGDARKEFKYEGGGGVM